MALKYTCEITINKPREEVVRLMDDPSNMKHWQPGFISLDHLSGTPGEKDAKSLLKYKMGKRDMEMTETIAERSLPDTFSAIYEAKNVWNQQVNRFTEVDANTTKWVSESELKMSGPMKLMAWLMPGMFKKQSQQYLAHFKAFAEEGKSLAK